MATLQERLAHFRLSLVPQFNTKEFIRNGPQWFTGREAAMGGGTLQWAAFGDFSRNISETWNNLQGEKISPQEQEQLNAFIQKAQEENRKERERHWEATRDEVQKEWEVFSDQGSTPYLEQKGLHSLCGCRVEAHARGARLIVPARDIDGRLWGYQRIYSEKLSLSGTDKIFREGARKEGLFHTLGTLKDGEPIHIAEGISTAISISMVLGGSGSVVSVFDAGNLLHVAKELRARYPSSPFIFCADDDRWPAKDGKIYRTGEVKAKKAAQEVGNSSVILPVFKPEHDNHRLTDFDDIRLAYGLDELKKQLGGNAAVGGSLEPKVKVTETKLAQAFLDRHDRPLIRQDKSLFEYVGTHWRELEAWDLDQIKNGINDLCHKALDSKKVNSIYATFFRLVPHVPSGVNLFTPNPTCGNFLDGTLRLSRDEKTGIYALSFSKHRKEDWVTWVIPVKYNVDRALKNERFEKMLAEMLEGEADKEGMVRALKQMGGAMLVPTFPQMFFLHGISGSRKSTLALSLAKLIHEQNISKCDPANMNNFEIEGMIGKLVNMHTDIDDHTALPRGFMKRFEDHTTMQVNRKGKPVVNSKLPTVHVYCANELPPNFEGKGKAFYRRVTLLEFKRDLTNTDQGTGDNVIRRYEELIWAAGHEGILNWCREGLIDLVNSGGKFFTPMSSLAAVKEWQAEKDPVEQFITSMKAGEIADQNNQMVWGEEGRIKPGHLWEIFVVFHETVYQHRPKLTRFGFYKALETRGVKKLKTCGEMHYCGIGVKVQPNAPN